MNFNQTVAYLYSFLPMFQREGRAAIRKYDLSGVQNLLQAMGNPHDGLKCIHVAGTNGKGSTCSMLASILKEAGFSKVGLYTSPHLKSFTERIRLNGKPVSEDYVVIFTRKYKNLLEELKPSFFEFTTAMAFAYFNEQQTDIAVIETGMGGRLDSTNVIHPILSVITHVSYDHTDFLGDTLEKIAFEKAGIIKTNTPVVISVSQPETRSVFERKAEEMNAPIFFSEEFYQVTPEKLTPEGGYFIVEPKKGRKYEVLSGLSGAYQSRNICGVLKAVEVLNQFCPEFNISDSHIRSGLEKVVSNSGLRGRMEIINQEPLTIADIAHNSDAVFQLLMQLRQLQNKLYFVIGVVKDKDLDHMLPLFPKEAEYFFVCPPVPRGLPADDFREKALTYGLTGEYYNTVEDGLAAAQKMALLSRDLNSMVVVTGSAFVVAEVL